MKLKTILPAVAIAIFNDQGDILLQRRSDRNVWGLISGHVEFGETVQEAVLREVKEETGLKVKIVRLIGVYSEPASQTYTYPSGETVQYITTYFEAQLLNAFDDRFSCDETLELRYFSPDSLPQDMLVMNPYWLEDALSKHGTYIR